MFLLNGAQSRAKTGGENASNYQNPEYDRLFEQMKNMENSPERQATIDRMLAIAREDAPWVWGFHPKDYTLSHAWLANVKPNQMARNGTKFYRLDTQWREASRSAWNRPELWPLAVILAAVVVTGIPAVRAYRRRERAAARPPERTA
jgi:ABC-type oligopeptide transport system substrate-binding subunit